MVIWDILGGAEQTWPHFKIVNYLLSLYIPAAVFWRKIKALTNILFLVSWNFGYLSLIVELD